MSQFEYLNRISIGQYLPTGSIIHRVDPRAKILGYTFLIFALTFCPRITGLLAAITLIFMLIMISKVPITFALRGLLQPLPFLILLMILQVFITPRVSSDRVLFSYGIVTVSETGVRLAALLITRFIGLFLLLTLASVTTSTLEVIYGLNLLLKPFNKIGLNTNSIAMIVQIMLRFIPFLAINAEKIAKSQASRGAGWGESKSGVFKRARQIFPLVIPLFSNSLQQADQLANAMLARSYGNTINRTGLQEYRFTFRDLVFLVLSIGAAWMVLFLA